MNFLLFISLFILPSSIRADALTPPPYLLQHPSVTVSDLVWTATKRTQFSWVLSSFVVWFGHRRGTRRETRSSSPGEVRSHSGKTFYPCQGGWGRGRTDTPNQDPQRGTRSSNDRYTYTPSNYRTPRTSTVRNPYSPRPTGCPDPRAPSPSFSRRTYPKRETFRAVTRRSRHIIIYT